MQDTGYSFNTRDTAGNTRDRSSACKGLSHMGEEAVGRCGTTAGKASAVQKVKQVMGKCVVVGVNITVGTLRKGQRRPLKRGH